MIANVSQTSALPATLRAVTDAVSLQSQVAPGLKDSSNRETVNPVLPTARTRSASEVALPRLSSLLLGEPQGAPAPTVGPDTARNASAQPGQAKDSDRTGTLSDTALTLLHDPKGPLRSFAEIPTRMTKEIQKAREAFAQQGGGLEAIQALMKDLSVQTAPSVSITV